MKCGIRIYVEGGSEKSGLQAQLRVGFDGLLRDVKNAARKRRWKWDLVPCGGRDQAAAAFRHYWGQAKQGEIVVLLVDSEERIPDESPTPSDEINSACILRLAKDAEVRKSHVVNRDKWLLKEFPAPHIHLMVQCMESWIVADPQALAIYYKQGFSEAALPNRSNLEAELKNDVISKLKKATKDTKKGEYAKIKHARDLLGLIDPRKVAARCPRFATFSDWLKSQIEAT